MTSTVIPAAGMAAEEKPITRVGAKKRMATDAIEDILYGSIAGVMGKYIEYPFDTVKVRLQSQPDSLPLLYKGPLDCLQQSFRQDGFLGMYRGISAPLVGAALETSSLFLWEQAAQKFLRWSGLYKEEGPLPLQALFLTGALSGAATSLVLTPVELVKCKIQVPTITSSDGIVRPPPTVTGVIRSVFKHQGLLGFWNGQLGTLIRETGGCAAWFGAKETVTLLFRRYNAQNRPSIYDATKPLPLWQQAIAGAAAGTSYNFLFFPADTIKSRMQTSAVEGTRPGEVAVRKTFWKEGNALYKQHGLPGLYRGCGITVARSAPSSAFIFIIYDYLKTHFKLG